jgi:Flp pilus assembly protein TadG
MLRHLRRLARNEAGTSFIEFAIAGPVVILALLGCIEFGRYFWIRNTLEYAVEEAGRYAILNKSASESDIQTQVRNKVMGVNPSTITVAVVPTAGSNVTYKTITATSPNISLVGGLLPVASLKLSAQTRVPVPD